MTTRAALKHFLNECEQTLEYARAHLMAGAKQEFYDDDGYTEAQQQLENCYNELMAIYRSANAQQREELHRMRLKIQSLQNEMTLLDHQFR